MLGKTPKRKVISEKIREEIRQGKLSPGDKLSSVKDLCEHFSAGQQTIQDALRLLEEDGLVEIRNRSGCYIRREAAQLAAEAPVGKTIRREADRELKNYMVPQRLGSDTIRLYVTDMEPEKLQLWREVLDGFEGAPVEVVSCDEGHLEEIYQSKSPDVVETTPGVLRAIGMEKFVPADALDSMASVPQDALIAPVRERIDAGRVMGGVPFSVTVHFLFVNKEMTDKADVKTVPGDPYDLFELAEKVEQYYEDSDLHGIALPSMLDPLLMSGAISWRGEKGFVLDAGRTRRLLEQLEKGAFPAVSEMDVRQLFRDGHLAFLVHCSFTVSQIMGDVSFPWEAIPLPLVDNVRMPGWLNVLAVSREASQPEDCAALVSYLLHPDQQRRFARLDGNLPVLESALSAFTAHTGEVLKSDTVERALEYVSLDWAEEVHAAVHHNFNLPGLRQALEEGTMTVEEGVKLVRYRTEFVPQGEGTGK